MRSKEYYLIKQSLHKLKADKKKKFAAEIIYIVVVGSSNTFNLYLLLLSGFFNFDFFFLILPNIISDNIPVPFL